MKTAGRSQQSRRDLSAPASSARRLCAAYYGHVRQTRAPYGRTLPIAYEAPSDSASRVRAMLAPFRASAASRSPRPVALQLVELSRQHTYVEARLKKRRYLCRVLCGIMYRCVFCGARASRGGHMYADGRYHSIFAERERRAEGICMLTGINCVFTHRKRLAKCSSVLPPGITR